MSIKAYSIRSIKCSSKVPFNIDLEFVRKRCEEVKADIHKTYPNFIVFSLKEDKEDRLTNFNENIKYTLFKYGEELESMHCNICGITDPKHTKVCVKYLARLLKLEPELLKHEVDNYCATTTLPTKINKHRFIKINPAAFHQFERFPAIFLRSSNVVILIYGSGSIVFTGAKDTEQIDKAFKYLESCYAKYMITM